MNQVYQDRLDNGVQLLAEPIPGAQSLAITCLAPAGVTSEPAERQGVAALVAEIICRGAGGLDARAHCDALDRLGVRRATRVDTVHLCLSAVMIHSDRAEALPLLMDMVRRPSFDPDAVEPSRDLALQAIDALEDEPQQKVFIALREQHFPEPFGRSPYGRAHHLKAATLEQMKAHWQERFVADGSILAFAGRFDWEDLRRQVRELLDDWGGSQAEASPGAAAPRGYRHVDAPTAQVHLGMAYDAVPEPDPDSTLQRSAAAILSGGTSGRLFTEVRERRGLCYVVDASYAAGKQIGAVLSYAGTTAAKAQETYEVLLRELRRLSEGIDKDEFDRAMVGMKSRLVMQGESSGARADAIAGDQYIYGRPRTLDELIAQIDAVTHERVCEFVRDHPAGAMTVVTVGPERLSVDR